MGYYWNGPMNNTNWWPFMVLMMLIVFAALFLALFALLRHYRPVHHLATPAPRSSAVAILQERFARGELNEEEYRLRLKLLRDSPPE